MSTFGFIVPVYNTKRSLLDECINSILSQDFQDLEIIVVDDGSTQISSEYWKDLALKDHRIKIIHNKQNLGLPSARNIGIDNCKAKWVCFIDSDDWIEKNSCSVFLSVIEKQKCDFYQFSGFLNYRNRQVDCEYYYDEFKFFEDPFERDGFINRFLLDQSNLNVSNSFPIQSACIKLVSMECIQKNKLHFINVRFAEDTLFHLYAIQLSDRFAVVPFRFYHYRCTEGSMVNSYRPDADKEQLSLLSELWKFADFFEKGDVFRKNLYMISFISMQICVWQKYFNSENKAGYIEKRKAINQLFSKEPYKTTLKEIDFSILRRNQKIKYVLMRLKMYQTLVLLRKQYNNNKNKMEVG